MTVHLRVAGARACTEPADPNAPTSKAVADVTCNRCLQLAAALILTGSTQVHAR
jgi:hypothetical protein